MKNERIFRKEALEACKEKFEGTADYTGIEDDQCDAQCLYQDSTPDRQVYSVTISGHKCLQDGRLSEGYVYGHYKVIMSVVDLQGFKPYTYADFVEEKYVEAFIE